MLERAAILVYFFVSYIQQRAAYRKKTGTPAFMLNYVLFIPVSNYKRMVNSTYFKSEYN